MQLVKFFNFLCSRVLPAVILLMMTVRCDPMMLSSSAASGFGGCSASPSGLNFANDSGSEESVNLEDGPVSLPITIAKNEDAVDPTTMHFELSGGSAPSENSLPVNASESSATAGTLTFKLASRECKTVGVYFSGALLTSIEADAVTCEYSIDIPISFADELVSYAVFLDGEEPVAGAQTGAPVHTLLNGPTDYLEDYSLSIFLTNFAETENAGLQDGIVTEIETDEGNFLAFSLYVDTQSYVYKMPQTGGSAESFFSMTTLLTSMSSFGDLIVLGTESNVLFADTTPTLLDLTLTDLEADSKVSLHPRGHYVSYDASEDDGRRVLYVHNILSDESFGPLIIDERFESEAVGIDHTWVAPDTMAATLELADGTFRLIRIRLGDVLAGTGDVIVDSFVSAVNPISAPSGHDGSDTGILVYRCTGDDGGEDICAYDIATEAVVTLVDEDADVSVPLMSNDGVSFAVFSILGEDTIGIYDFGSAAVRYLAKGHDAYPSQVSTGTIFLYGEMLEMTQIGVHVVEESDLVVPDPVAFVSSTQTIALGESETLRIQNGKAPYVFSLVSGPGTLNTDTGHFQANTASGTAVVRVTDADGDTDDVTVSIPVSCPDSDDFSGDVSECWAEGQLDLSDSLLLSLDEDSDFFAENISLDVSDTGLDVVSLPAAGSFEFTLSGGEGVPYFYQEADADDFALAFKLEDPVVDAGETVSVAITSSGNGTFLYFVSWNGVVITRDCVTADGVCTSDDTALATNPGYICISRDDTTFTIFTSADGATWTESLSESKTGLSNSYQFGVFFQDDDASDDALSVTLGQFEFTSDSATCPTF